MKGICKPYSNLLRLEISKRKPLLEENQTFEEKGKIIKTYGLIPRNIDSLLQSKSKEYQRNNLRFYGARDSCSSPLGQRIHI